MGTFKSEPVCQELLSEIMKRMHEGVLILNALNILEQTNEAALKILGYTSREVLVGKHISELQANTDPIRDLFSFLADGSVGNLQDRHKDLYSLSIFQEYADAQPLKLIILHDIRLTNKAAKTLAQNTQSLEKTNQELDHFAHIVSHDLKAPLRAISNLSLWLEEDLGTALTGENRDNFTKLRSRVLRMESLINGILNYSKVGREQVENETIDISKLLSEVIESLAPPSHIKIQINLETSLLEAPRTMLFQVFSNLISNAIKYNDKTEGLINVYGTEKGTGFEFVVEDNGPGISPEYHEKIFTIFQTLQSRDKFESTGIGLTIVRRILAGRGGVIRVESQLNAGSQFIFTWPKQSMA